MSQHRQSTSRTHRPRLRTVRTKVLALLVVPIVSLMALWGYATVTTASNISGLQEAKEVNSTLVAPVNGYTEAVQAERAARLRLQSRAGDADAGQALRQAEQRTGEAIAAMRRGVEANTTDAAALSPQLPARIGRLLHSSGGLGALRKETSTRRLYQGYNDAIAPAFSVRAALTRVSGTDDTSDAGTLLQLARAREALSRQDALLGDSGSAAPDGWQYRDFTGAVYTQRELLVGAVENLRPEDASRYEAVLRSGAFRQLTAQQRKVLDAGPGKKDTVSAADWRTGAGATLDGLAAAEKRAGTEAAAAAGPLSPGTLGGSGLAVGLGFLGVLLSLLLSVRVGRGLVAELSGLRNSALEMARSRLPQTMRRIHSGEQLDLEKEAPLPADPAVGEAEQVGAALTAVQRAALRASAERAEVLSGLSGVYVGLARRSQVLLHRQLDLLDTMERRVEDPAELEDLFRLDHLTTRMRRHAESLLILSGSAPGRSWRSPVPLLDVVRAGVSETQDLARVELGEMPPVLLGGPAVTDVIHLIAELTENAVAFSPPHTTVRLCGQQVGSGAVLEIEDRGLGMSPERLAAANERIGAEDIDLLDSRRLGLFVVNRLARRQGLRVALHSSAYGGVTAVILIPDALLSEAVPVLTEATPEQEPVAERTYVEEPTPAHAAEEPAHAAGPAPGPPPEPVGVAQSQTAPPDEGTDGLPKRVRQASLAPGLRREAEPGASEEPAPGPVPQPRSPDAARATMASLRSGRHRAQAPKAPAAERTEQAGRTEQAEWTERAEWAEDNGGQP